MTLTITITEVRGGWTITVSDGTTVLGTAVAATKKQAGKRVADLVAMSLSE